LEAASDGETEPSKQAKLQKSHLKPAAVNKKMDLAEQLGVEFTKNGALFQGKEYERGDYKFDQQLFHSDKFQEHFKHIIADLASIGITELYTINHMRDGSLKIYMMSYVCNCVTATFSATPTTMWLKIRTTYFVAAATSVDEFIAENAAYMDIVRKLHAYDDLVRKNAELTAQVAELQLRPGGDEYNAAKARWERGDYRA